MNQPMPMLDVLQEWLRMHRDATVGTLVVFMAVAQEPGISGHVLAARLGLGTTSVSRHLALLAKNRRPGIPGFDLIEVIENPNNRRERLCYLTIKGQQLFAKMRGAVLPEPKTHQK